MKRRIVLVQSGLGAGGAEKIVNMIAKHRAENGDDVHVIAMYGTRKNSYFEYPEQITLHSLLDSESEQGTNRQSSLSKILWLRRTIRKIQPDVVLSFLTKINFFSTCALLNLRTPLAVSERNNPNQQRAGKIWRMILKFTFKNADQIVMQTKEAMSLIGTSNLNKTVVIPNPSSPTLKNKSPQETSSDIVAVGRLTKQKGFDVLINSVEILVAEQPKIRLTIWGEGEQREYLEHLVTSKNLEQNVFLPGNTKQPMAWLNSAKVFALSSRYEGFPNVLAEAMSAGMACVSTDCPWGPTELIDSGHNGTLVPVEDAKSLAQAIDALLRNPLQQTLYGKASIAKMGAFSKDKVLNKWDEVLEKTIQSR